MLINGLSDKHDLSTHVSHLRQNKMNHNSTIKNYYLQTKEAIQSIKMIAKQNEKYKNSWVAIKSFIDETSLAAFIAGLSHPYFGYMQAARLESLEDAYSFLFKFKSHESTAINMNTGKVTENNKFFGKSSHDLYPSNSKTTRRETNNSV